MAILKPLELLWRGLNRIRRSLYRRGVLKARRLPRPVISIGNLSAGGSGKTPAVIAVASYLSERGFRVAVLTRGYGRGSDGATLVDSPDAALFGDEPVLIKSRLTNVDVIVGPQRHRNAIQFLEGNDCDVFVLDDGFQHLQLARDVDIVVDSPTARIFREGRRALRDADFVIPRRIRVNNCDRIAGKRVFAFAGLADNDQFFRTVVECGATLAGSLGFRDHHRYSAADVRVLRDLAREAGAEILVTTEKDAVKIADRDIIPLAAEMVIDPDVLEAIATRVSR
jgi:tetraacyldisaccharide 4'-kinase